ncbi:phosphoinositide phospholipase C 2-like [Chenopodium quinoa]|uniref:phosphoinositide phospholipase C 2-like n=1 Tax=Chenopodium quinoa TaxID=63459 RepID=UPI000B77C797|nr:phosphoinositide phospholipase C 2-like [Chenopodium quinoa]
MSEIYGNLNYCYRRWFKSHWPSSPPDDVTNLFNEYKEHDRDRIRTPNLAEYLKKHQDVAEKHAVKLAPKIIASRKLKGFANFRRTSLSKNGFFAYLLSSENHPLDKKKMPEFDGNAKLAHYFVYTSNCSYLERNKSQNPIKSAAAKTITMPSCLRKGHRGESESKSDGDGEPSNNQDKKEQEKFRNSITAIEKALLMGIRVIELDVWLNSDKKGITISHPGTKKTYYICNYNENPENSGILRLTENEIESARSTEYTSLTQTKLLAVYPNSDDPAVFTKNFDPLIGWTRRAQMVAINPQNFDKHLWVMQGLFRAQLNQDCKRPTGYVKKPNILLNNKIFDRTEWRPVKKILKVKVYLGTGWHLDFNSEEEEFESDYSPPDFFTAVEIVGVPVDEAREKTVPVMDQWVPVWDQEFKFPLTVPELAMLLIEVKEFDTDRTHDFGGQTCLPVWLLRSGIRSVPLYDKKGILMRFEFN